MTRRRAWCAAAAFALAVTLVARASVTPGTEIWVDDRVGMAAGTVVDVVPGCRGARCMTAAAFWTWDGGAHWHRVWLGQTPYSAHPSVAPTSATAAALLAWPRGYWTRDRGRHWYATNRIGNPPVGRGSLLFWARDDTLFRVAPWPPRRRVTCPSPWVDIAYGGRVAAVGKRNICDAVVDRKVGLEAHGVARVPDGVVRGLASVPGGVAAVVLGRRGWNAPRGRVLVHRFGRNVLSALPELGETEPRTIFVEWPHLVVLGYEPNGPLRAAWHSLDGGRTWSPVGSG